MEKDNSPKESNQEMPVSDKGNAPESENTNIHPLPAGESEEEGNAGEEANTPHTPSPALKPAPSLSRTTNIPPLMPAGFVPAANKETEPKRKSLIDKIVPSKSKDAANEADHEIGPLRTDSEKPCSPQPAPQKSIRHNHGQKGFWRKNCWWVVLLVLVLAVLISLPWTLPQMQMWNHEDEEPALPADTPAAPAVVPQVNPDTIGAAARADSLRQDSIKKAAAREYWRRHHAAQEAQQNQEDEEEGESSASPATAPHAPAAAHGDSTQRG